MRDRQPTKPGRVLLTPEDGSAPFYAVMSMADEPTDFGTPPTKMNLLTDETEVALFGDAADRTVNQAFSGLAFKFSMLSSNIAQATMTVKDTSGAPVPGVVITGMFDASGGIVLTDGSGVASGYVAAGNVTLAVKNYADLEDASDTTFEAVAGGTYNRSLTVIRRTYLKLLSSKTLMFSGSVETVDVALISGGQGGGPASETRNGAYKPNYPLVGGRGGNSGGIGIKTGLVPQPGVSYQAVVGAAGPAGGYTGGISSFMGVSGTENICIGGSGASEKNVNAQDGASSSKTLYASETENLPIGGAGGGGAVTGTRGYGSFGKGGSPHGGRGATGGAGKEAAVAGVDGTGAGGGGASVGCEFEDDYYVTVQAAARGGSGCITMRIHLKAA